MLGEQHPDTARSLNNLGSILDSQGDYAGAREHYQRALEIFEAKLGPQHPNTTIIRDNLTFVEAKLENADSSK